MPGNPNPSPANRWKKGESGNPTGAGGGRPKLSEEEKTARKRLKELVASRADVPVKRMYAMLERHDKAVADGERGASKGVLSPDQELKILTYLNDWGNGKAVETMRTVPQDDDVTSPLDMSDEERAAKIASLKSRIGQEEVPEGVSLN